jgi:hypothetical protein
VRVRAILATIGAIVCLAAIPASSLGQSLSNDAYSNQTTQVLGASESHETTPPTATTSSSGTLPFTGLQIALVALAGVVLVGSGFALRRASRSSNS